MCSAVFGHQSWGLEIPKFLDLTLKLGFAGTQRSPHSAKERYAQYQKCCALDTRKDAHYTKNSALSVQDKVRI